jgi:insecticidal toxin complex protein TccC
MDDNSRNHHHNTPDVAVTDNRGLTVREIQYHRHPDSPKITDERITRHTFTDRGHLHTSADPRLSLLMVNGSTPAA